MEGAHPREHNDYSNITLRVKRRALVLDCFGASDVAPAIGPLRIVDPAAIAVALAPEGAVRAILAGIRPSGTGINLAFVEQARAAGFEARMGEADGESEARRQTALEVAIAAMELAASPDVEEVVLACPREHVDVVARRVRGLGKRVVLADHARTSFARYRGLVDGLIELPSACWPQARRVS